MSKWSKRDFRPAAARMAAAAKVPADALIGAEVVAQAQWAGAAYGPTIEVSGVVWAEAPLHQGRKAYWIAAGANYWLALAHQIRPAAVAAVAA